MTYIDYIKSKNETQRILDESYIVTLELVRLQIKRHTQIQNAIIREIEEDHRKGHEIPYHKKLLHLGCKPKMTIVVNNTDKIIFGKVINISIGGLAKIVSASIY